MGNKWLNPSDDETPKIVVENLKQKQTKPQLCCLSHRFLRFGD